MTAPAVTCGPRALTALQWRVIALCSLATFLDGYDVQALGLAIPHMAREFGIAPPAFRFAASGSLVGMALGAMLLSSLADRLGRRPLLIAMLALFGLATLGAVFAHAPLELAAWRVLSGLGLGATVPIAISITSETAPPERRAALITLMASFAAFGAFAGGLIAPLVIAPWGWRGIFGAGAVTPLVAALLCVVWMPETLPAAAGATRAPGARVGALFASALRARTLLLWGVFAVNLFVNYSLISWLPTLLIQAGWDPASAARASGLIAIGGVVGGLAVAALADRGHALGALVCAYLMAAAALALCATAPQAKLIWVLLLLVIGMGAFGAQIALGSLSATYYPAAVRSTGVGWASGVGRVGSFFGPLALAALMTAGVGASAIIGLLMLPMLFCLACILLLPRALATPVEM